jgi:hypothetical protein
MPIFTATEEAARKAEVAEAIATLNNHVIALTPGKQFSDQYLDLIAKAQEALSAGQWEAAQKNVWSATFFVNRAIETKKNRKLIITLAFTPLFTFALLFLFERLATFLFAHDIIASILSAEFFPYLWTGAIGGMTISYWGLVKHTVEMDFDDAYKLWYWFKPLLGAVFGLIAVVIVKAGLVSIQGPAPGTTGGEVPNTLPLHIIAFIAGFSERFFVQLIDRVMTALFGGSTTAPQPPAPPASAQPPKADTDTVPSNSSSDKRVDETEPEHPGLP